MRYWGRVEMGDRAPIHGTRRRNKTGSILRRATAAGGFRYHTRLHGKYLGSYESRSEAERVLKAALEARSKENAP
jgi:hypothetical protein